MVESFAARFPGQFLNVGVAEQNMTGVAAGMALCGKIVFTYSIANFPVLRCLEQIRNDVCYHRANVKIVAVGGGLAYGALGATHHATEDLAIMRALPEMTVVAPGDPVETAAATQAIAQQPGPGYLRLGRAGEAIVHIEPIAFQLGKALEVRPGNDLAIFSTGGMLETAVSVSESLRGRGLQARVLSMHTIRPLDEIAVLAAAKDTGAIFTLEEHSITGGLGGAVAEVLAEGRQDAVIFKRFGLPAAFSPLIGSQQYLRGRLGLGAEDVAGAIRGQLVKTRSFLATASV